MAKVFISYRREISAQVDALVADIDKLGHDVWIDRHHEGNQQWWNTILANIAERDAFIPVYDINYDDSYPCCRELDYAVALQRQIIPVVFDKELPENFAPRHSRAFNYVQYSDDKLSIINLQNRLSKVVEIPNDTGVLHLQPGFPTHELNDVFEQHIITRPAQSENQQILSLDRIDGLIGNDVPTSEIIFLLEEHKRRGPQGGYGQVRPNDIYSRIKERLNRSPDANNGQITPSVASAPKSDSANAASTEPEAFRSQTIPAKTANQNSQTQIEPDKANSGKMNFLPLLSGFAIGALVGGVVSPNLFYDTAALKDQNDKLSKEIPTLMASNEDELKQLQNTHKAEIDAVEKQLEEQKNLTLNANGAVSDAKALVRDKESEIAKLEKQLAALEAQGQGTGDINLKNAYSDLLPGLQMIRIPEGTFLMGSPEKEVGRSQSEGPQHEVAIQAFELSDAEVTFEQYDIFASETKRKLPDDHGWGRGDRPVINVSWNDAIAYITWLNEKTGDNFRLPSEAEWEYAARAGTTTPYYSGDCISTKQANYDGKFDYNNCGSNTGEFLESTLAVRNYKANNWNLFDMAGNVWEWTQDCWHNDYTSAPVDGSAWLGDNSGDCKRSMLRGGGFNRGPEDLRSAYRSWYNRDSVLGSLGFRLARTP